MIHLTPARLLSGMSPALRGQLACMVLPGKRWETIFREGGDLLCVVAMKEGGIAVGWSGAERDGLTGCFVLEDYRRQGLGFRLVRELVIAAAARWPGVALHPMVPKDAPSSPFWDEAARRLKQAAGGGA